MRTPNELMLFVALAGTVALTVLWTLARWRTGAGTTDPAARLLGGLALVALGAMLGAGPWTWIVDRYGPGVWAAVAAAAGLFLADWARERRRR